MSLSWEAYLKIAHKANAYSDLSEALYEKLESLRDISIFNIFTKDYRKVMKRAKSVDKLFKETETIRILELHNLNIELAEIAITRSS